jgi:hypothetical protein
VATSLAEVGGELDAAGGLLGEIDRFAQKSMRIRLIHLSDAVPQQLRTLLSTTIASYENEPALLRSRMSAALARVGGAAVTERVLEAAERVLAVRAALRRGVLELVRRTAAARLPLAQRAARDRLLADEERDRWRRARVDLEQVAARADAVERGSFAERIEKIAPPAEEAHDPEEPEVDPAVKRFSLIEID